MIFYDVNQPTISMLPSELIPIINSNIKILKNEWNINKDNYLSVGGFVLVVQDETDLDILSTFNIDLET